MKKSLLFVSLLTAMSVYGQTSSQPTTAWANILTGIPGQDQSSSIAADGKDAVYWMFTDGSKTSDRDVVYCNDELYQGASYDGTSSNKNLTLLKTDADGNKLWCVYSAWGDFSPNEGGVAVKSNGDVVFSCTVRHTDGYLDKPVTIVDAKGKSTEINWDVEKRWLELIVGTVTSDGELLWVRTYDIDNTLASTGAFLANSLTNSSVTVDDEGNIYVGGNFRSAMTFPKADNTTVTLQPKNIENWKGDSQSTVGSLYLVKLDSDGYYLNHLAETGSEIAASYIQNLEWKGGYLYVCGYLKGKDDNSVKIAGVDLTPTQYFCPLIGCLNGALEASWLKCLPGDAVGGASVVQNVGLTVEDGSVWYAGMFNGKISDPSDNSKYVASASKNPREGFIIELSVMDGSWKNGVTSKQGFSDTALTGYSKVIVPVNESSDVYVYGYNMTNGVFLRCYDRSTLDAKMDDSWYIITSAGMVTSQCIDYVPEIGAVYTTSRSNKAFLPINGQETEAVTGFVNLLARFDMPKGFTTGINEISNEGEESISINIAKGVVIAENNSDVNTNIIIFDLTGRCIYSDALTAGERRIINLESGIYIMNGRKVML